VEFWLSSRPGLFAAIVDSEERGVYAEVVLIAVGGSTVTFQNTEDCGLQHSRPDSCFHCGLITPEQLLERALRDREPVDCEQMNLVGCVGAYEQGVNEELALRRRIGIRGDQMEGIYKRLNRWRPG
jgi:hypothetical protein